MKEAQGHDVAHDLPSLAKELGMPLPADTRVVYVHRESGMDDMVRAKLTMPRASFERISPQLPLSPAELSPGPGRLGTDHNGWDPHATAGLRTGQAQLAGARVFNLGVVDGSDGTVTLFVVNHGT